MAGVNTDHLEPLRGEPNPVPNFIHCRCVPGHPPQGAFWEGVARGDQSILGDSPTHRSYLDMLKVAVFRYLFWLVLVVVFVTGATRISIFGLGYLLACFYLLLFGTVLLQKDTRAQLVLWDCLILYNVTVIISKNMLSVSQPPGLRLTLASASPLSRQLGTNPPPSPSSYPVSLWSKCRAASVGSSSFSASCAQSKATTTVSG